MRRTPFGTRGPPADADGPDMIGDDSSSESDTDLSFVSTSVKSGAFCPTCGAPVDAGSHLDATNATKMNIPSTNTLSVARTELTIFEMRRRSGANARRTPMNSSNAAIANSKKFAHGKLRVTAQLTNTNG